MKSHFWDQLSPRERKLVLWISGFVLLYALIGFLILPPIVRSVAVKQISQQLGREVSIQSVKINPFTLSAAVRGLLIKDKDGEPFVSWDEVYVNFQLSSFFGRAWVFKEISTSNPYVRVEMNKDYTFNFSDLIEKFSTNSAPAKIGPSQPIRLHVGRLHIGGATASLTDFTPREPFKRRVGPLDITLMDFRTDPDNKNPYAFTGTTDAGETISWRGYFYLDPLRSAGELKLFNFALNKYAPLYQDLVRFEIRDGTVAMDMKYRLEFSPTNRVAAVDDFAWALRDFKLGVPGDSNNIVESRLVSVTGAKVDLEQRNAVIGQFTLDSANLILSRDTNAEVNVVELAKPAESPTNAPGGILFLLRSVTNAVAMLLNSTNQWSGTVQHVVVTNCAAHLSDDANAHPARLDLSDISLDAKNISNLSGTNLTADFSVLWNTNGSIKTSATATLNPLSADVNLDLDKLNLKTLDAYLADKVNVFILGSEVNLHGTARLRPQVNDLPVISFTGDASLENFHTVDGVFAKDLVKWDALRFNHIVANLNPPLVAISEIVVDNAFARLSIETNHTINLLNVLKPASTAAATTNAAPATVAATATTTSATTNLPIQLMIGAVIITNTALNFSDHSLQPSVHLALQSVNGRISDLSSEKMQHAMVDLGAKVDGVGPVAITGTVNPLNGAETNEIKISVKDVDLTPASPYAGKFAGYGIAEGKLNLDLAYVIVGKKVNSKNVITLDQFTFGEKVNSPDATHLPVRLAVAILKDRDGKIVLDVPIEGSMDDPKFRIGKVVTRALVNILEKVATSPFSLIGAAFGGGGEELGWQEFAAGSVELTATDKEKLDKLVKVLTARPALRLEIAGSVEPVGDREGLERAALDHEIRSRMWMKLRKSERATNSVDQLVLTPDDRDRYIRKIYAEAFAAHKITPELIASDTNLAAYATQVFPRKKSVKKGAELLMHPTASGTAAVTPHTKLDPPPSPMEALVLPTFAVSDADFQALAIRRAKAVQSYLIQSGKVEASRVFLTVAGPETLRRDGSRTYLQFR